METLHIAGAVTATVTETAQEINPKSPFTTFAPYYARVFSNDFILVSVIEQSATPTNFILIGPAVPVVLQVGANQVLSVKTSPAATVTTVYCNAAVVN